MLQDWLAAVEVDTFRLDARSTRVLATMTVDKDLLLSVVNMASATTYEGPHMSWGQLVHYLAEVLHVTQHDLRRGLLAMKQGT